jgi:hypothetical protein
MKQRTIITPVARSGEISPVSILVEKSRLWETIKTLYTFIVHALALIGAGLIIYWMS